MYTVAAPVILVVSYGTTRLLSGILTIIFAISNTTNQINYDTSQLYHGLLMGMVLHYPRVNDVLPLALPLEGHH